MLRSTLTALIVLSCLSFDYASAQNLTSCASLCEVGNGETMCCGYAQGVCCPNGNYCCAQGLVCGDSAFSPQCLLMTGESGSLPIPLRKQIEHVICPNRQTVCPDKTTCCDAGSTYNCCPLENAICCSDGKHCCPHLYTCDLTTQSCISKETGLQASLFSNSIVSSVNPKLCPNGGSRCGSTCCPFENAVCCGQDEDFCCPSNYRCNLRDRSCEPMVSSGIPWLTGPSLIHAAPKDDMVFNVSDSKCHDGSRCPSGSTCCLLRSGDDGCCPMPNAQCCADRTHCCPANTVCDLRSSRCIRADSEEWPTLPLVKADLTSPTHECADKTHCSDFSTCCKLSSGNFGCCAYQDGVCCEGGEFCCPTNSKCVKDAKNNLSCVKADEFSVLVAPTRPVNASTVCPDASICPGTDTCCASQQGGFSCCPMPYAQCCRDGQHCCPHGTVCSAGSDRCYRVDDSLEKFASTSLQSAFQPEPPLNASVVCPDGKVKCPGGTTCCQNASGFGCCPLPQAVCCSDGEHCCPSGYRCDLARMGCTLDQHGLTTPLLRKLPAEPVEETRESGDDITCPDGDLCPASGSCCALSGSGRFTCCPFANATCCAGQEFCCPSGFHCTADGRCADSKHAVLVIEAAKTQSAKTPKRVMCPDNVHYCRDGAVCCQDASFTSYRCCNHPGAICCPDGKHCCPHGTRCDPIRKHCVRPRGGYQVLLDFLDRAQEAESRRKCPDDLHECPMHHQCDMKLRACRSLKTGDFTEWLVRKGICPGGRDRCDSGQTCCPSTTDGSHVCCPFPNASCCSDGKHCCPENFECDSVNGGCKRRQSVTPVVVTTPALNSLECPGGSGVFCRSNNTCCARGTPGSFSCCAFPDAVCCSNGEFCCPKGTQCNLVSGRCMKEDSGGVAALMQLASMPALQSASKDKSISCDVCRFIGGTCCDSDSCCLLRDGVCCPGEDICCPSGSRCTGAGGCTSATAFDIHFSGLALIHSNRELLPSRKVVAQRFHQVSQTHAYLNQPAIFEPRLKNPAYRMIKSAKWNICPDNRHFCPMDTNCCASLASAADKLQFSCTPRGFKCCETLPTSCPGDFQCSMDSFDCQRIP